MSNSGCKEFSDGLCTALSHMMIRDVEKPPIPAVVMQCLNSLKSLVHDPANCNGVTLRLGLSGSSSEMMRRVSEDHYELYVNIAFPFQLTPIRDEMRPGCVMLQADASVEHPTIENGFLDRGFFAQWFLRILKRVLDDWGYSEFWHNFTVKSQKFRVSCLPVLEFEHSQWPVASQGTPANVWSLHSWYAVPQATRPLDPRSFVVWAPDWERCVLDTHPHSRRLLRLFDGLAQRYSFKLKNFELVIRTIMLQEVQNLPRDLGDSMIAFVEAVLACLQQGTLKRFLVDSVNVLQLDEESMLEINHKYLSGVLKALKKQKIKASNSNYDRSDSDSDSDSWMSSLLYMFSY